MGLATWFQSSSTPVCCRTKTNHCCSSLLAGDPLQLLVRNVFILLLSFCDTCLLQETFGSMASQMREHLKEEEDTGLALLRQHFSEKEVAPVSINTWHLLNTAPAPASKLCLCEVIFDVHSGLMVYMSRQHHMAPTT